ncbi:molybdopterin molybdotransferase MoeA [Novosphingobium aerophilum]|uniref:molybdopterin molybdotransferase MoeA n=1 Tax=Novosphingobium TaxID=165696 RepID=UPI002D79B8E4|nr:molybdopterin molybdotransferase MoeA [Novosphingobium sp. RL4]WRT91859.1 molybdopterin molybdotransferase MoeA [Novosphingobium sp. RL4]
MKPHLSLEEAQSRLLALVEPLPIERVDIDGALGRFLAEPLRAHRSQPPADLSAMDGYAVTADLSGPWRVIGESAAGHPYEASVGAGEAVRISTGAMLPEGAQAVILQEDLAREGQQITLTGEAPEPSHRHIRRCGMDFVEGRELLAAGTLIGPAQAALGIAAGHRHLPVRRIPRVTVIDSGDELSTDPEFCANHQVPASNGVMLVAMARSLPVDANRIGPVADKLDDLIAAFEQASDSDVIVTSGGASVGDHDLVRPALEAWGAQLDFWRVAIKPGKPLLVATRQRATGPQIIIGLPGNPVSSLVTAYQFLLPVLRALLGASRPIPQPVATRLSAPLPAAGNRREFLRGYWNGETVCANPLQDSGALASLAASNVLIDRPIGAPAANAGDVVEVFLLQNGGIA